jgi:hypothetical protein
MNKNEKRIISVSANKNLLERKMEDRFSSVFFVWLYLLQNKYRTRKNKKGLLKIP